LTKIVQRLAQSLDSFVGAAAGVCLDALAPAPQDEYLRAELRAQVHRGASLLHGVSTHLRIVSGKRAVAEDRLVEEVDRGHRHDETMLSTGRFELAHDAVALRGRGINRHEVVIVEVDAPRADFPEQ